MRIPKLLLALFISCMSTSAGIVNILEYNSQLTTPGSTDDWGLVINEIESILSTDGGGTLLIPPGVYSVKTQIRARENVAIQGTSPSNTTLRWSRNGSSNEALILVSNYDVDYHVLETGTTTHYVKIENIGLDAHGTRYGLYIAGIHSCQFENIYIYNAKEANLYGILIFNSTFSNIRAINGENKGIVLGKPTTNYPTSDLNNYDKLARSVTVDKSRFSYLLAYGNGGTDCTTDHASNIENGVGVYISNIWGTSFDNITCESNKGIGLLLASCVRQGSLNTVTLESNDAQFESTDRSWQVFVAEDAQLTARDVSVIFNKGSIRCNGKLYLENYNGRNIQIPEGLTNSHVSARGNLYNWLEIQTFSGEQRVGTYYQFKQGIVDHVDNYSFDMHWVDSYHFQVNIPDDDLPKIQDLYFEVTPQNGSLTLFGPAYTDLYKPDGSHVRLNVVASTGITISQSSTLKIPIPPSVQEEMLANNGSGKLYTLTAVWGCAGYNSLAAPNKFKVRFVSSTNY